MSDTTLNHDPQAHDADDHADHEHHVVGWKLLTVVFLALMVLTILTVAAINVDLGPLNIVVALGIALVKALLVVFIFMHIWWDRAFHGLLIGGSLFFVTLFIAFTMIDTTHYEVDIHEADLIHEREAIESGDYSPAPALIDEAGGH
ncbi:cytochrome C oxidase subunit IV family protein [Methylobacterium sp.]|uniref:cytochrome C oxidase subunit IV family protein n=1 Tax=Methylobacterium sp. TaxID=409 RepID=UPI003B02AFD4